MRRFSSPQELEKNREEILNSRDPSQPLITVCGGTGCHASGCHAVVDAFKKVIQEKAKRNGVGLRCTGCHGFCERGPLVVIHPRKIFYQLVKDTDAAEIIDKTVLNGEVLDRLLYTDPNSGGKVLYENEVTFYKKQMRLVFGMNGQIDTTSMEDYLAI